ncbi:uncharacterized protein LOC144445274 [Glandiceps talaboti]
MTNRPKTIWVAKRYRVKLSETRQKNLTNIESTTRVPKKKQAQQTDQGHKSGTQEPSVQTNVLMFTNTMGDGISEYSRRPIADPVKSISHKTPVVVFDLDTTSLKRDTAICQIAAEYDGASFDTYVDPQQEFDDEASQINGFIYIEGQLFYKGDQVQTESLKAALKKFIEWIPQDSVLVAHNNKCFDALVLVRCAQICKLEKKLEEKCCFSDSLPIFREILRDQPRHSLQALAEEYLNVRDYRDQQFNAIEKTKMLRQLLMDDHTFDEVHLQNHSFTVDYARKMVAYKDYWELDFN